MKRTSILVITTVALVLMLALAAPAATVNCSGVAAWSPNGVAYATGALVTYQGSEYKCTQGHTSQAGWDPVDVPALWSLVGACSTAATPTPTATAKPTATATAKPTATATAKPTATATATAKPTATATAKPTATPTATATPKPTATATPSGAGCWPAWNASTAYSGGAQVSYGGENYQAAYWTQGNNPSTSSGASGSGQPWIVEGACGGPGGSGSTPTPTPTATAPPPGTTTGTINFHLLLGVSNSEDSITLDGGNYTDLIMSNMIAGVMYGHLVEEGYPGIQYNKDYLYGSVMGQLLQENLATEYYVSSSDLIDSNSAQQPVMGVGQGGPYQINNYAVDMVSGSAAPAGHSLINYIAVQKNIGYTMANAATQTDQPTPPSFNNKYYGPMLPAYFHYNDMVALNLIGKGAGGWTTPWEPEYDEALANFDNLPNSFLDVILNVAYNQGYYGGLVAQYSTEGATATASTVASVNSYTSVWGNSSTYVQYPYQVHYYLDQMYGNPIPTTSATTTVTPGNHIVFNVSTLEGVFSNVFQLLDYSNGTNAAQYFTAAQAQSAFSSALSQNSVSSSATLDLSNASDRATIFAVIDSAISSLESAVGMKFNATTTSQL